MVSPLLQRPRVVGAIAAVSALAVALLLVAHFQSQKPPPPATLLTWMQMWLRKAEPSGPKGQFKGQFINVYRIFAYLPDNQRELLLKGVPLPVANMPAGAQLYVEKFVQHAAHSPQPIPVSEATMTVQSVVVRSQPRIVVNVSLGGKDLSFTIFG
jgi:hypothetical protein